MKKVGPYQLSKKIGAGCYGTVYEASRATTSELRAVKMIERHTLNERLQQNLETEVKILKQINHPNVINLNDLQKTSNNYYLIFEYANGGDLDKFIAQNGRIREREARQLIRQLLDGLGELRKHNIIHRDLKLANLLLHFPAMQDKTQDEVDGKVYDKKGKKFTSVPVLKIADLGFAKVLQPGELAGTMCGTPLHMPPEILKHQKYDYRADIWSLGTIVFEMLTGFTPFTGRDRDDLRKNIEKGDYKLPKTLKLSVECVDFLNRCLQFDPEKRFDWEEIKVHPFIHLPTDSQKQDAQTMKFSLQQSGYYMSDSIAFQSNPYKHLNENNAILMNCKDPETYKKFFKDEIKEQPKVVAPVVTQINEEIKDEEEDDDEYQDVILDRDSKKESKDEDSGIKINVHNDPIVEVDDAFKQDFLAEVKDESKNQLVEAPKQLEKLPVPEEVPETEVKPVENKEVGGEQRLSEHKSQQEEKKDVAPQNESNSPKLEANSPISPVVNMENVPEIPSEASSGKNYIDGFEMIDHEETVGSSVIVGNPISIEFKEDHFQ